MTDALRFVNVRRKFASVLETDGDEVSTSDVRDLRALPRASVAHDERVEV
jgi:hypothetical protein